MLLIILASFGFISDVNDDIIDVKVNISGITKIKGEIRIAIYSEKNEFPSKVDIMDYRVIPVDKNTVTCTFSISEKGKYAMALVQDLNGNGDMDFNFIGFPKEPYAFSNNPGIWHRAPTFKECAVELNESRTIEIKL